MTGLLLLQGDEAAALSAGAPAHSLPAPWKVSTHHRTPIKIEGNQQSAMQLPNQGSALSPPPCLAIKAEGREIPAFITCRLYSCKATPSLPHHTHHLFPCNLHACSTPASCHSRHADLVLGWIWHVTSSLADCHWFSCLSWLQMMLLSDGSVTRHLQLLTGQPIQVVRSA